MENLLRRINPYLFTLVLLLIVALLRGLVLGPFLGDRGPYSGFTLAILAAAWVGGFWPGVLATGLSVGIGWFFFMQHSWTDMPQRFALTGIFFVTGVLISAVCESLRLSRRRSELARSDLEKSQKENEAHSEALLKIEHAARVEAERSALMKDEFLATVSHEMRTPLNAMLGWVQLLRHGSLAGDAVPQALETIERNARTQAKLINDLLDMSRILSGRLRLEVQSMNVIDAVEAAIATAEPAAAAKKIRITREFTADSEMISGDPTRVQQVVWNLLNNAVKFTPSGGTVAVAVKQADSLLEITVSDDGEGMSAEFLPHVFERFRQQDASTGRRHQGLGLGLSIVKQLTELHGGSVAAASEGSGRGSVFTVRLPVAALSSPRAAGQPMARWDAEESLPDNLPSLLGVKVLVVDDDHDARELLRSILAHHGASVRTAGSAADAMQLFEEAIPQVLVSDIAMPDQDGYDLIRKVREREESRGGRVPAVALTAFSRSEDRRRAIGAGFNMHLSKPVEPAELLTVVASLARAI